LLVLGAQVLEHEGVKPEMVIQGRYQGLVIRSGLYQLALTASLFNVRAIMLLSLYPHNAGEHNAAWLVFGQAARMAIALGMHRECGGNNFDPIEWLMMKE
jgi:hypothetical protein